MFMVLRSDFKDGRHGGHIENATLGHWSAVFVAIELKIDMWVARRWTKNISDEVYEDLKFDLDLTFEFEPHPVLQLSVFFSETTEPIKVSGLHQLSGLLPSNEDP